MFAGKKANRVLARMGARTLSEQELEQVSGGIITANCTFDPKTCKMDGDCEPPIRCPL
jgi:bacteriocin-like protein